MYLTWTKLTFEHQVNQIGRPHKLLHYRTCLHILVTSEGKHDMFYKSMTRKAGRFVCSLLYREILGFIISCVSWHQCDGQDIEIFVTCYVIYSIHPCSICIANKYMIYWKIPLACVVKSADSTILEQSLCGRFIGCQTLAHLVPGRTCSLR